MDPTPLVLLCLQSIARLERAGVKPSRLTEPGHEKWLRIRRKLRWVDFIALLHQDLATAFPHPFDLNRWNRHPLEGLPEASAEQLVATAMQVDPSDSLVFLRNAARALGLPIGGAISDLPRVQPHHRMLELPGTFGRIAAQQVQSYGLAFHEQFVFVADTDAERLLVGLSAVEMRANEPRILSSQSLEANLESQVKQFRIDRAFGLQEHPLASDLAQRLKPSVQEVRLI